MMSEPAQKCQNQAIFHKTILQKCLLLLKWSIIAVLALEEIQISSKKSFITPTTGNICSTMGMLPHSTIGQVVLVRSRFCLALKNDLAYCALWTSYHVSSNTYTSHTNLHLSIQFLIFNVTILPLTVPHIYLCRHCFCHRDNYVSF